MQKLLDHRYILANQIFVNLEKAFFKESTDEYHVKVAETITEAAKLITVGYEHVSTMRKRQIHRKRK